MSFRVCLIGCGALANDVYADSLLRYKKENPSVEYAACCDINKAAASEFAIKVGFVSTYTNYTEMMEKEHPDAILLVTPYTITAPIAVQILHAGYPIMLEKPPGVNARQAMDIAAAAIKTGVCNQVAFNRRHIPLIRELIRELNGQEIRHITYQMHRVRRTENHFHTTAIHGIDIVRHIARAHYTDIHFIYQPLPAFGEGVLNTQMLCRLDSGASAQLSFCPVSGLVSEQINVTTDDHTFFVDIPIWNASKNPGLILKYKQGQLIYRKTGDEITDGPGMFESNGFFAQLKSFLDNVRNGILPENDIHTSINSVVIADCIVNRVEHYCANT